VRFGKQNLKIPKGTEVEKITYADVLKWAEEDPKASKSAKKTTKTATKKATTKKK
jgi:DNA topoisomerase-1